MVHTSQAAFNGFHLRLPFRLGMQIIQVTWTTDGYPLFLQHPCQFLHLATLSSWTTPQICVLKFIFTYIIYISITSILFLVLGQ